MTGEISVIGLIMGASTFVLAIVVILIIMSIISWAVILKKTWAIRSTNKNIKFLEQMFTSGMPLQNMFMVEQVKYPLPMSRIFLAVVLKWSNLGKAGVGGDKKDMALEKALEQAVDDETEKLDTGLHILAIVSSTSPFVGLLGTVWGIMNSFVAIASNKQASLSVVAPGIAEALFVTALGLITAIPAMIAYNKFSHDVDVLQADMDKVGNRIIYKVLKDASHGG